MSPSKTFPLPIVILHRPQIGENIGMSARAMANCGLNTLRVSCARPDWDMNKARAAATCGADIIDTHRSYDDLSAALADCHVVYATSARRRDMPLRVITPEQAAIEIAHLPSSHKVALLFGAEASGLSNNDLARAQAVIEIPLCPGRTSLNLSQAVLLCAYCCWQQRLSDQPTASGQADAVTAPTPIPATHQDIKYFLGRLHSALQATGFFRDAQLAEVTWRNVETMMHRAQFQAQEIQTWHGILSALQRRQKM